jgi:shikimate kinase
MGCGKSVVGVLVAQRTGAKFYDLDVVIESEVGMSISEFFASHGEEAFRKHESRLLPVVLQPGVVVALGGGAPTYGDNWRIINESAVTVFLDCPFEVIWTRTRGTTDRPLMVGRTREQLEELYRERAPIYGQAVYRVMANRPPDEIADEVAQLWSA